MSDRWRSTGQELAQGGKKKKILLETEVLKSDNRPKEGFELK